MQIYFLQTVCKWARHSSKIRAKRGVSNNKSLTACSIGDEPISRWEKNPYWHHGGGPISWFIFEDLTKVVPIFYSFSSFFIHLMYILVWLEQLWEKGKLQYRNCCLLESVFYRITNDLILYVPEIIIHRDAFSSMLVYIVEKV